MTFYAYLFFLSFFLPNFIRLPSAFSSVSSIIPLHLLCFSRAAFLSSPGQLHPFSQTKVNLHNNEPYKGGMTSSVSGPKLFCTTFTFHCSDDRAGMWRLIPCGVGGCAGPAAVEQTSVPPYKKQKQKQKLLCFLVLR